MDKITLDFRDCRNWGQFHQIWKNALGFPYYYGENWSALWDCLKALFDDPTLLELYGVANLEAEFDKDTVRIMVEILDDLHERYPYVTYKIVS